LLLHSTSSITKAKNPTPTQHHYYSKVGAQLMQENGALEKKEKINFTQVRSVARSLLPLNSLVPHWILQDTHRKCYNFVNNGVLKMHDKGFLSWCTTNPRQFQLTPCGAPNTNKDERRNALEKFAFNYQQGKRALCVPLCI
jgi:hypothetical protein